MDTSWEVHWGSEKVIIDPWLLGSEVDYFQWFNEQWHTTEPMSLVEIEKPNFILISLSYSDHCHEETLQKFAKDIPILASPKAYKRLKRTFSKNRLIKLPILSKEGFLEFNGLKIATLDPRRCIDPIYYAHVICNGNDAIFYSSHGFSLDSKQLAFLKPLRMKALLTSFSEIRLPSLFGGKVNPGLENVDQLIGQLNPTYITNTHDEQKTHSGLVMKMAKTNYPDLMDLEFNSTEILTFNDYQFRDIY